MTRVVAIHQPNFFPWLGYFDKIARSDVFIFLDDVQFPKTGGVWCNRVKLIIGSKANWVTAAIDRNYHGLRHIKDMRFLDNNWREKMQKSLVSNYRRHPFFEETMAVIQPSLMNQESNVAEYNIMAVIQIAQQLGIDVNKFKRSSDFAVQATSNELLIALVQCVGGNAYLCGGGSNGYQEDELFERSRLDVYYQAFEHPVYLQRGQAEFVAGLSIIDLVMNLGWDGVSELLDLNSK